MPRHQGAIERAKGAAISSPHKVPVNAAHRVKTSVTERGGVAQK
jgi:hypothetical protein